MAYTTPKTWTNEPLVASDLNTHLRDNMEALKDPPSANYELNESSDYSTTSASFVDVDGTNLSLAVTTTGGDLMVHFHGSINNAGGFATLLDLDIDGSPVAGDDGIITVKGASTDIIAACFTRLITGLSAGAHTIKLQWKVLGSTSTLYAGAGTSNKDVHPQFWVREVS